MVINRKQNKTISSTKPNMLHNNKIGPDKIQKVKTDRSDRPEEDVKIIKATILD